MIRHRWVLRAVVVLAMTALCACANKDEKKRAFLEQGNAHLAAGRTQEAIIAYRNAIKLDRMFGEAHWKLAEAYVQAQSPEQAGKEFLRAAELMPENVDAQVRAATIRLLSGDFQGARNSAEAALKVQPRHRFFVYQRYFDWFRYWLKDHVDPDPERAAQYERWDRMRSRRPN